jgi:hypothetical protein
VVRSGKQEVLHIEEITFEVERNNLPSSANSMLVPAGEALDQKADAVRHVPLTHDPPKARSLLYRQTKRGNLSSVLVIQGADPFELPREPIHRGKFY